MDTQRGWSGIRTRIMGRHLLSQKRQRRDAALLSHATRDLAPEEHVLDVGAGNGFLSLLLARKLPAGRVTAVDLSSTMLDQLRRRAAQEGLSDRVQTLESPAQRIPLEDGTVDRVVCSRLLHEVTAPRAVVAEMARVLRPGGRVVIQDLRGGSLGRLMVGVFHRGEGTHPLGLEELDDLLAAAGLVQRAVEPVGIDLLATARKPAL